MAASKGLMGLKGPSSGYEGVIQAGQQRVQVKDGHFSMQGREFFVSEAGGVTDGQGKPVAVVRGGQLMPLQQQAQQQQGAAP